MLALQFGFKYGRYHATPWNNQVNEGKVEWPPYPWRFLRALVAAWYNKQHEFIDKEDIIPLLDKLSEPPYYLLPPTTIAHTRHYMPKGEIKSKEEAASLILDTFIAVSKSDNTLTPNFAPLIVFWENLQLTSSETGILGRLLHSICYFGRSESLVDITILNPQQLEYFKERAQSGFYNSVSPTKDIPDDEEDYKLIKLLVCMNTGEYNEWKEKFTAKGYKVPGNTFEALQALTSNVKKDGWSLPPGSKWIRYNQKKDKFDIYPEPKSQVPKTLPTIARFAVASKVPLNLKYALSLGEKIHKSLVRESYGEAVFTGCDKDGQPLKNNEHAHIFSESLFQQSDKCKIITNITIYAPMGFNEKAEYALHNIEEVRSYGRYDTNPIHLLFLGIGHIEAFEDDPLLSEATCWKSMTPFVPTRHPKFTRAGKPKIDSENGLQIGSPQHDLLRLLKKDKILNSHVSINVKCELLHISNKHLLGFTIRREMGGGLRFGNTGYSCSLEFDKPIKGPIALGYGSHFGLGLFAPM